MENCEMDKWTMHKLQREFYQSMLHFVLYFYSVMVSERRNIRSEGGVVVEGWRSKGRLRGAEEVFFRYLNLYANWP